MSLQFLITSIVITATPGTGALLTIAAGLSRGWRAAVIAAIGCTLGIVPHLALALSGAAAVLAVSPIAFEAIKWLGVAYLLHLAWGTWRQNGILTLPDDDGATGATPVGRVIGNAVLANLLNPKLTLFFFVFLPIFIDPSAPAAVARMAELGSVFMAITLVIFVGYGLAAAWLRRHLIGRPAVMRWIGRGFACCLVLLAVLLGFTHR